MGLWNFGLITEPKSWWWIVYTTNQENKLKSLSIQINTDDGILFKHTVVGQVWMGLEMSLHKNVIDETSFVTVGFVYGRWRSTVTDKVCRQEHLTRHFSHAIHTR